MKDLADKCRSDRIFAVGDRVFLKLQLYVQSSEATHSNQKLAFRYFGPYKVLQRIGAVAYKLQLPPTSTIHPVFHVSQLRKCFKAPERMIPFEEIDLQQDLSYREHPVAILEETERKTRNKSIKFLKVKWSHHTDREATWE